MRHHTAEELKTHKIHTMRSNSPSGDFKPPDHESGYSLYNVRVRVYTSIFPKSSTLSRDVEITYSGVFWSQKVGFGHKKYHGDEFGIYRSIMSLMSTSAKNAYFGV